MFKTKVEHSISPTQIFQMTVWMLIKRGQSDMPIEWGMTRHRILKECRKELKEHGSSGFIKSEDTIPFLEEQAEYYKKDYEATLTEGRNLVLKLFPELERWKSEFTG